MTAARCMALVALLSTGCWRSNLESIDHGRGDADEQSDSDDQVQRGAPPRVDFLGPALGTSLVAGPVTISLHVDDGEQELPAGAVDVSYSVDNRRTFRTIAAGLSLSTLSTDPTVETVAVTWDAQAAGIGPNLTILQATVRDGDGNIIKTTSGIYNSRLTLVAGGRFDDNGVSADLTMLGARERYDERRASILVRDPIDGTIFVGDIVQGLRLIDGSSGVITRAPLASDIEVTSVARDDGGIVYGCNAAGVFTWERDARAWRSLVLDPCERIAAHRSAPELYWLHANRLYRYDGNAVTHVAFDGTSSGGPSDPCYALAPAAATTGCAPQLTGQLTVDGDGGVLVGDGARHLRYRSGSITSVDDLDGLNVTYRSSTGDVVATSFGVYDEDPASGELFLASAAGVAQYAADVVFDAAGLPQGAEGVRLAGIPYDLGNGGRATRAHLGTPTWIETGVLEGAGERLFVQRGSVDGVAQMQRMVDLASDAIEDYAPGLLPSDRTTTTSLVVLPSGGFLAPLLEGRPLVRHSGAVANTHTGGVVCTQSPTAGASAMTTNWPSSYRVGIGHSDGHVYLAGYRFTSGATPSCGGRADVFIERFPLDVATGAVGTVEHVMGTPGLAATDTVATGQSAQSFSARSPIRRIRENLTAGAGSGLVVLRSNRLSLIRRVDPDDLTTWTITDITRDISGVGNLRDFVIDTNVNATGTSGHAYFVSGNAYVVKYALGSGATLADDTLEVVTFPGTDNFNLTGIAMTADGDLLVADGQVHGAVYRFTP